MNSLLDRPGFKLPYMGMRRPNASPIMTLKAILGISDSGPMRNQCDH